MESSVIPEKRHPPEGVAIDRDPADGWEWQVGRHQLLARRRQLSQEADPNVGRLFRVVFESVVPVGLIEPDREDSIAGEGQPDVT